jgi:hypothetical protein
MMQTITIIGLDDRLRSNRSRRSFIYKAFSALVFGLGANGITGGARSRVVGAGRRYGTELIHELTVAYHSVMGHSIQCI